MECLTPSFVENRRIMLKFLKQNMDKKHGSPTLLSTRDCQPQTHPRDLRLASVRSMANTALQEPEMPVCP